MRPTQTPTLPPQPTPFVGRSRELEEVNGLLADPACRLLTIVGPGGMGKTRLALHGAQQVHEQTSSTLTFLDGVLFVSLIPVRTLSGMVATIADAASFTFYSDAPPTQQLLHFLREKELLLILDNFEHLLESVELLTEILAAAPGVKLLVTSREVLNLQEEWIFPLDGLDVPPATRDVDLSSFSAVQLFVERARRVRRDFVLAAERDAVVGICQLVDGMPLALELAAAWVRTLPCAAILAELTRNLAFLTTNLRNVPERHRSMRAVFEHSWQLITEGERDVLMRLSVFRGSFCLDAAECVAGASLMSLATLVEKSLLRVAATGRYQMHELLRQFAGEKLKAVAPTETETRERHSAYYLERLTAQRQALLGSQQQRALAEIGADIENVRAAWQWAVEHDDLDVLDQALASLYDFYQIGNRYQEGAEVFAQAAAHLHQADAGTAHARFDAVRVKVAARHGAFRYFLAEYQTASEQLEYSLSLAQRLGLQSEMVFALDMLGRLAAWQGQYVEARQRLHASLAIGRELGDQQSRAKILERLAEVVGDLGDLEQGKQLGQESLAISRQLGRPDLIAHALDRLAFITLCVGEYSASEAYYRESLALFEAIGHQLGIALELGGIGLVIWARGGEQIAEAVPYFEQSLAGFRELGHRRHVIDRLADLAILANEVDEYARAEQHAREGLAIAHELRSPIYIGNMLRCLAETAYKTGDFHASRHYLSEALKLAFEAQLLTSLTHGLFHFAALLWKESDLDGVPGSIKVQRQVQAWELLELAIHHPASWHVYKVRARGLQAELEAVLPPAAVATARARSHHRTLEAVVAELLSGATAATGAAAATVSTTGSGSLQPDSPLSEPLTEREREVLRLIAEGRANQDIAKMLILSLGTVKWYVSQILGKLAVHNRTEAVARARELDLL